MANPDGSCSSSLPFEQLSKFKNSFERLVMAEDPKFERSKAVKNGTIAPNKIHELFQAVGLKVTTTLCLSLIPMLGGVCCNYGRLWFNSRNKLTHTTRS